MLTAVIISIVALFSYGLIAMWILRTPRKGRTVNEVFNIELLELKQRVNLIGILFGAIIAFGTWIGVSSVKDVQENIVKAVKPIADSMTADLAKRRDSLKTMYELQGALSTLVTSLANQSQSLDSSTKAALRNLQRVQAKLGFNPVVRRKAAPFPWPNALPSPNGVYTVQYRLKDEVEVGLPWHMYFPMAMPDLPAFDSPPKVKILEGANDFEVTNVTANSCDLKPKTPSKLVNGIQVTTPVVLEIQFQEVQVAERSRR